MNTLKDKIENIPPADPIDQLIFTKGLRIRTLFVIKDLDLLVLVLNNGKLIKSNISQFTKLKEAPENKLSNWRLRGNGTGISWGELDEDLSLRGFIKEAYLQATLHDLEDTGNANTFVM